MLLGLVLYGVAIAFEVRARLGLDPWDVLHQGLARRTGIAIGTWVIVVGGAVLGILRRVLRHLGGREAAGVEGDAAVLPAEAANLRLPAAMIAGELVHEHDRRAGAGLL